MIERTDRELKLKGKIEKKLEKYSPIFRLFYVSMCEENKSFATIDVYLNNILHFANFHTDKPSSFFAFKDVTSTEIEEYLYSLKKGGSGDDILQGRWSSLNTFFTWAEKKGYVEKNPLNSLPRPKNEKKHTVTYLTKEQICNLLNVIDNNTDEKFRLRDKTVISLALTTALRIGALVNLNIGDIDLADQTITVKEGSKKRKIHIGDNTVLLLSNWLKYRNSQFTRTSSTALFLSKNYERMSVYGINDLLAKYCGWAGLSKLVFSDLTETAICNLIEHHIPLQTIIDEYGFDRNERLIAYVEAVFNNRNESSKDVLDSLIPLSSNTSFYKDNYVDNDPNHFEIENGVLVKYIGDGDADTVVIPGSVNRIYEDAFSDSVYWIEQLVIPHSVTYIDDGAFDFSDFENIIVDPNNCNYCSKDGVLFNKESTELIRYPNKKKGKNYIIPKTVKKIRCNAFSCCENIASVKLSEGIVDIDDYAFYECSELLKITFPNSLKSIGENSFERCYALTEIYIPNNVEYIGCQAFRDCHRLSNIIVSPLNTTFCDIEGVLFLAGRDCVHAFLHTFPQNKAIDKYIIPNGVQFIEDWAFYGCRSIKEIHIPETVEQICDHAFFDCTYLKQITGMDGVDHIGNGAFCGCENLTHFHIPNGVKILYDHTFLSCKNLVEISIPSSVTRIDNGVFEGCKSLKHLSVPESVKSIGEEAFMLCESLTEISISHITEISEDLLEYCGSNCKITRF